MKLIQMTALNINKAAQSAAVMMLGLSPLVKAQTLAITELPTVLVTAAPMGAGSTAVPATVLVGESLTLQKSNGLGELLSREVGVSTTGFGVNASRPVIRGMDSDRIKLLNNGGASHDVAGLSYDHATPIDPLLIERIEVLRGPATLLFGGGAVGGVVNAIDNRIPRETLDGLTGTAELRGETGKREVSSSVILENQLSDDWAMHVDAFKRRSTSTSVPIALPCTINGASVLEKKVCNTQAQTTGAGLGVSRVWRQGFAGASLSTYHSNYGTPAEDEVTVTMKSTTLSLKGEQRAMDGIVKSVAAQANFTRYTHTELDAGTPATQFNKRSSDARITFNQRDSAWANSTLTGTTLLSMDNERFSALGEEAFVPQNKTTQAAIATLQTLSTRWGSITAGARLEKVSVTSNGGPQTNYLGVDKFIADKRSFTPSNLAVSTIVNLSPTTQLIASVADSQRAPTAYELFANGAHVATGAYETGNTQLSKEQSRNLDVALQWSEDKHSFKIGGFYNRFKNYIGLSNTGNFKGANGEPSPLDTDGDGIADGSGEPIYAHYQYQAIQARFMGIEAQGQYRVLSLPYTLD